ncbi:MAG: type IV pilus assembly protein PilM [Minisyncoccota bacterium]
MVFGFRKTHFLGIDFGTASIKAVELSLQGDRPVLVNYGQIGLADLEKKGALPGTSYDDEVKRHLKALMKEMHPKSHTAHVAMPAFTGLISSIEFPVMGASELQEAVRFEAHKYIPSALDEVALSWEVMDTQEAPDGTKKMDVLLVAALNKEVVRYEEYIASVGLSVEFLELETFSIARSVIGSEQNLFLVIDIGSRATNLILIQHGTVRMSRNVDVGGRDITRVLAESLNITQDRAKIIKKSGKDFLLAPESVLIFPGLQTIASEAGRMLSAYQAKYPDIRCQEVILSGGSAQFYGLTQYYANLLNLPVTLSDTWKNIDHDPRLTPVLAQKSTSFSVALGAALRGIDIMRQKKTTSQQNKSTRSFSFKELMTKKL